MRRGKRFAWVMIVLAFASTTTLAQQPGGNVGGGQGGGGQGGGGQGGGGQGGGGLGGGGQGGGGQGGMATGTPLIQLEQAPQITAPGSITTGGTGITGADASNILNSTYANPYYQGTPANAKAKVGPGGFGSPLYGTATGGAGGRGGIGGTTGGRAGIGARGGLGGLGGRGLGGAGQDGVIVPLPISISYPAIATFPITPVPTSQLQVEISGMIARTRELTNPAAVTATVDKGIVTLRGTVRAMEEAKTLASMIRLTPGVRGVKNDLVVPKP